MKKDLFLACLLASFSFHIFLFPISPFPGCVAGFLLSHDVPPCTFPGYCHGGASMGLAPLPYPGPGLG